MRSQKQLVIFLSAGQMGNSKEQHAQHAQQQQQRRFQRGITTRGDFDSSSLFQFALALLAPASCTGFSLLLYPPPPLFPSLPSMLLVRTEQTTLGFGLRASTYVMIIYQVKQKQAREKLKVRRECQHTDAACLHRDLQHHSLYTCYWSG